MSENLTKTAQKNYKHYTFCRFCKSKKLIPVIDLGLVPLAGGFLKFQKYFKDEQFYPLEIYFCKNCFLLQSVNVIERNILFENYYYHSSAIKTLTTHFETIAADLYKKLHKNQNPFVVEIGSNDGTLIKALLKHKIPAWGIDPAANIVKPLIKQGLPFVNDYFTETLAKRIAKTHGKADVIFSSNTMAHIEDMHDIIKGVKALLKPEGFLMFEVHYLGNLLDEMQYDMIYHEHQYYYSLLTLQKIFAKHNMEIFDIKPINLHAGSMRYYVQKKKSGVNKISKRVLSLESKEIKRQYNTLIPYENYAKKIEETKKTLLLLLKSIKQNNKSVAGYGASGRGTVVSNYCGLTKEYMDVVIDDAPAKQGAYMPGTHQKIISSEILSTDNKPDYVLLFAWSFFEEIRRKNKSYLNHGGQFILPLPKVTVVKA